MKRTSLCLLGLVLGGFAAPAVAAKKTPPPPPAPRLDPELLAGFQVRSIGPAGMSGRIGAIEGVPGTSTVYVGAATGGLWKSDNGGISFTPIFDDQPAAAIGAVAVSPVNPDIVWVGTGEANVRNSASVGNGVYRSLDGGKTWKHLGLAGSERIHRILPHPTEPDTAYLCATGPEWGEGPERGVFRTRDGGASWQKVLFVDERTGCGDLALDPANPNHLLANLWQFRRWPFFFRSGGPSSGLYSSWDGGTTWTRQQVEDGLPEGPLGRIGLAFSRSNPAVVYALVEAEKSALLRSTDGGRSWQSRNTEVNVAARPFYFADLRIDPEWPNRVYSLHYGVDVSEDAGKTFSSLPGAGSLHGDFHAMWIDPQNPRHLYLGDDGGVGESWDRGATARHVENLPLAQFYHVAVDNEVPYNILGGLQDNGSWRGPSTVQRYGGGSNHDWELVGGGDGFDVQPDPTDSKIGYGMSQGGFLFRWNLHDNQSRDIRPPEPEGTRLRYNWNAGFAIDPFTPATIYYGSQFVHRSTDRGETWTILSPDLTANDPAWQKQADSGGLTPDVTAAENYSTILSIAPSAVERGVLWVGSDDGRIHVTRDGGATWTSVETNVPGVPKHTWIPHIEASAHQGGEAFVVFDDHRRSNHAAYVYKTTDYGRTWTSLVTPDVRGWALVVEQDPVAPNLLFLGTEFGLYLSIDGGKAWTKWKSGLPTVSVMDLVIHPRDHDLVIATHGRALYVLDDIRPLREISVASLAKPLELYPGADSRIASGAPPRGGFGPGDGEFQGASRPYGAILTFSVAGEDLPFADSELERTRQQDRRAKSLEGYPWGPEKPTFEIKPAAPPPKAKIQILDAAGKEVRSFERPVKRGLNRVVWRHERTGPRNFPPSPGQTPNDDPQGPELPPGTYTVVVKWGDHEDRGAVTLTADPSLGNSPADWQVREAAIERVQDLWNLAADSAQRIREVRADVSALLDRAAAEKARLEKAEKEKKGEAAETEKNEGEKKEGDEKAKDELSEAGDALKKKLDELEKRVWQSPDTKGIVDATDLTSQMFSTYFGMLSTFAPPSPTHEALYERTRAHFEAFVTELNQVLATDVEAFRQQADARGVSLLRPVVPVEWGKKK
jgi:photosystem II stability/assembly factor-like uncharacterized protein